MISGSERLDEAEHMVELLRRVRHRYTNYFQVTYGWLQLGETNRALQYLAGCRKKLEGESRLMRHAPPPIVLALVETDLELETRGIALTYKLGPLELSGVQFPAEFSDPCYTRFVRDLVLHLADIVTMPGEELHAEVTFRRSSELGADAWVLSFCGDIGETGPEHWSLGGDLDRLMSAFEHTGFRAPSVDVGAAGWRLNFVTGGTQAGVC